MDIGLSKCYCDMLLLDAPQDRETRAWLRMADALLQSFLVQLIVEAEADLDNNSDSELDSRLDGNVGMETRMTTTTSSGSEEMLALRLTMKRREFAA